MSVENSSILKKLNQNMINEMLSFLQPNEVNKFSHSSHSLKTLSNKMLNGKAKATKILHLVLNPNKRNVKKLKDILSTISKEDIEVSGCPVLIRTYGQEEYEVVIEKDENGKPIESLNGLKEAIKKCNAIKRSWKNISPLEAAAWSGDNFLVKELLHYVPNHFYGIAIKQLQGILNRKQGEENGVYLSPFRELILAYQTYEKEDKEQSKKSVRDTKILDEIMLKIGVRQGYLSSYGLQEFCAKTRHYPIPPDYNIEPERNQTMYDCSTSVHTEILLLGLHILNKQIECRSLGTSAFYSSVFVKGSELAYDRIAIEYLCEVRENELQDIIHSLVFKAPKKDNIEFFNNQLNKFTVEWNQFKTSSEIPISDNNQNTITTFQSYSSKDAIKLDNELEEYDAIKLDNELEEYIEEQNKLLSSLSKT